MSELLTLFSNNLLPILIVALAGYIVGRTLKVDPRALSRVVLYLFSPSLVFNLLTTSDLTGGNIFQMLGFSMVQMLAMAALAWGVVSIFRLDRRIAVAVILTAMLPNAGNYGMSLNQFAFGEAGLAYAGIYFVGSGIVLNTVGVFVASLGRFDLKQAAVALFKMPTVYGVLFALLFNTLGWTVPVPVGRAVEVLGGAAIPGMLVLLGLQLQSARWSGNFVPLALAVFMRLGVSIAVGMGLAPAFGLAGLPYAVALLEGAMPTAVMTTVLATEFDVEPAFVTQVVFFSTLLSPFTLTPLLAYVGG